MTRYCSNCGGAVPETAAFCTNCGSRAQAAPRAASPAPPPAGTPAAATGGGGLAKVLLIIGLAFVVLIGIGIAGVAFVAYKAKNAVEKAARNEGIELGDLMKEGKKGTLRGEPCSFLSADEASQVLGVSITRAENSAAGCNYYIARSAETRSKRVDEAPESLKSSEGNGLKDIERIAKEVTGAAVDPNLAYLMVQYNEDGQTAMTGFKIAMRAMGSVDRVTGVGDEAMAGPLGSMFIFMKNGIAVQMDLRQIANGREKGIELGKLIAARL